MMVATIAWLAHNAIIGSPAAVVLEIFFLGSNILGYWRYYIRTSEQIEIPPTA
jgi:hypothetical protein